MRYWNTEREKMIKQLSVWEKAMSWRKRQMVEAQFDPDCKYERDMRNRTLEEVAREFEKMKVFEADTMASIAVHIRNMKA
jgi:uncharacterized protein (DUF2235 family)